jgi:hypothetical protein
VIGVFDPHRLRDPRIVDSEPFRIPTALARKRSPGLRACCRIVRRQDDEVRLLLLECEDLVCRLEETPPAAHARNLPALEELGFRR